MRIGYYLKLVVSKPQLMRKLIYERHIGLIFMMPLEIMENNGRHNTVKIRRTKDVSLILKFYARMNRQAVNEQSIRSWIKHGNDCLVAESSAGDVVGAMWVFKSKVRINSTSGKTLSSCDLIQLSDNCVYGAYVIVDPSVRGQGVNRQLLAGLKKQYGANSRYQYLLVITGASNGAYIRSVQSHGAKIIGIVEVMRLLGLVLRREYFIDRHNELWRGIVK